MEQKNVNNFFRSYKKIWFKKDFGYTNCVKEILVVKYFEQKNMQVQKDFMVQKKNNDNVSIIFECKISAS